MKKNRLFATTVSVALFAALAAAPAARAQLKTPRLSPQATVSQVVGLTDVSIAYCRPGVKGRVIWGGLVPYDKVWRTGANEATTITFGDDVTVDGHPLPAGTYGLFTIPGKDEWTVIFNKDAKQWGAFHYNESADALRIKVKPQEAPFTERMTFSFPNTTEDSTEVALNWEKLMVPFSVKVDVASKVLPAARKAIKDGKADDWQTPLRAATFCIDNDIDLDEAAGWVEKSIAIDENCYNLTAKARLLEMHGKKDQAIALAKRAIELGKAAKPPAEIEATEALLAKWQGGM
jgi:Protein of unknown function (DUF2911)